MIDLASRPARLAAELAWRGADVVVVGGTARWLRAGRGRPRDLDVAVAPASVPALVAALRDLGVVARVATVLRCGVVQLDTGWGRLDVFVGTCPAADPMLVDGVRVTVQAEP